MFIYKLADVELHEEIRGVGYIENGYGIEELSIDFDGFCLGRYPNFMSYCCRLYALLLSILLLLLLLLELIY